MVMNMEWSEEYILRTLDLGDDEEWGRIIARLAREGLPDGQTLLNPGRIALLIDMFCERLSGRDWYVGRARQLLAFIPRSAPFVRAFFEETGIPARDKMDILEEFSEMASQIRELPPNFELARRALLHILLDCQDGRYGWQRCGLVDVQRVFWLLGKILPPPAPAFSARLRRTAPLKRSGTKPRTVFAVHRLGSPAAVNHSSVRLRARKGGRVASAQPIPARWVAAFLNHASPELKAKVFSLILGSPRELVLLAGLDISEQWQRRIQEALEDSLRSTVLGQKTLTITTLRQAMTKDYLQGGMRLWAGQVLERLRQIVLADCRPKAEQA